MKCQKVIYSASNEPRLCKRGNSTPMGHSFWEGFDLANEGERLKYSGTKTYHSDVDVGVSEGKKLVHAGNENNENEADDPRSKCR